MRLFRLIGFVFRLWKADGLLGLFITLVINEINIDLFILYCIRDNVE